MGSPCGVWAFGVGVGVGSGDGGAGRFAGVLSAIGLLWQRALALAG